MGCVRVKADVSSGGSVAGPLRAGRGWRTLARLGCEAAGALVGAETSPNVGMYPSSPGLGLLEI